MTARTARVLVSVFAGVHCLACRARLPAGSIEGDSSPQVVPSSALLPSAIASVAPSGSIAPSMARCPAGMAAIPAGTFQFRVNRKATVVNEFCMDITEVTVAAYVACVNAGACSSKGLNRVGSIAPFTTPLCNWGSGRNDHPINCVSWYQTVAYCKYADKRVPTEAEWEYAASGGDGRSYPWGETTPTDQLCWDGAGNTLGKGKRGGNTCPVGSFPAGRSVFGLDDMAGGVWEWTSGKMGIQRIIRGGGATTPIAPWVTTTMRTASFETENGNDIGVRCAR